MKIKFDILFEVIVEHDYFKDKTIKDLSIKPTENTLQVLNNYGLLFRNTAKGFVILYEIDTTTSTQEPLKPIITSEKFSFEIYINDSYFNNYTNIPIDHKGPHILYFNNLDENIGDSKMMLNKDPIVGEKDISRLIATYYNIQEPATSSSTLLEVIDSNGTTVFSKSVVKIEDSLVYQIDFDKIGAGWFDIKIGGISRDAVYVDKNIHRNPVFGIIDIYATTDVPSSYRFVASDGAVASKVYNIRFAQRTTTWKYYVILNNIDSDPSLVVIYQNPLPGSSEEIYPSGITFSKTPLTAVSNELVIKYGLDKVFLFKSSDELPLFEIPKSKISLIKPDSTDEDVDEDEINDDVITNLPNANITAIKPIENEITHEIELFSEIFIYV
ncbi:hypothetical protein N9164_04245 [Draconibacterium sp.]|nr:hypothetical protein [Draconibacterium sp.]